MRWRPWFFVILICVSVTAALAGFKVLQIRQAIAFAESFPEHAEAVRLVVVKEVQWTEQVSALGEVLARSFVDLRNELGGRIVELGFPPGAKVSKDQLLLRLDTSEESAQLRAAQAEMELARLDLERHQRLIKTNASSKDQYDRAKAELSMALARAQALQAIINKKTLRAPFDAEAGLHELQVGQYLAENTLITRLVGTGSDVWVDFNLPQQQAMLAIGTKVTAKASGLLSQTVSGEVIARDSQVAVQSRNMRIRAVFYQVADQLKPGAIVEVQVPLSEEKTFLTLPKSAIRHDDAGAYVHALLTDNDGSVRASKRRVILGPVISVSGYQQTVAITGGLEEGERIAGIGSYKLRDGMLVILKTALVESGATDHD